MFKKYLFLLLLVSSFADAATTIKIAAAADLQLVMQKLFSAFKEDHKDFEFLDTYGSSGNFVTQIENGADFDLFFSADNSFAEELVKAKLTEGPSQIYTQGLLDLCGADKIKDLSQPKFKKIAIANPAHAPYGRVAVEAMKNSQTYDQIQNKIVLGENISQTAQFVQVKAAQAGFVAQSLTLSEAMKNISCHPVDSSLYSALNQSLVIMGKSKNKKATHQFVEFVMSSKAQGMFSQNGFKSAELK